MIDEIRCVPPLSWRRDLRGTVLAIVMHGGLIVLVLLGLNAAPPKVPTLSAQSMVVELVPMSQPTTAPSPQPTPQPAPAPLPVAAPQAPPAPPKIVAKTVVRKAVPAAKPAPLATEAPPSAPEGASPTTTDATAAATNSADNAPSQGKATEQTDSFVPPRSNVAGLDNPRPPYPTLARRRGWEGLVVVLVWVNELGAAQSVELHQSSGHDILDRSALDTVKSWRFVPARRGGHTVPASVQVPIRFSLDGKA